MDGSLNTTYGAGTLASFLSAALFGFTFLQTYTYFIHRSSDDPLLMKLGIGLLWIVDCLQVLFMVWGVYWYLVKNFGKTSALRALHWPIPVAWLLASTGSFIAGAYFVPQIWTQSHKNKGLTGLIALASVVQYAISLAVFVHMIIRLNEDIAATMQGNKMPIIIQQVCAIIGNNAIVIGLCLFNDRQHGKTLDGASVLERLLIILLDRGLLSGFLQVVYLFVYVFRNESFFWIPFQVATSKLLVNAILAKLNSRVICVTRQPVEFSLGSLGALRQVPMNEQVMITTTKSVREPGAHSISNPADID
ncbi:hypothetical protein JB92DRAFT_2873359 [Gautieria morchelliformis]|nr:hypothetical protein JB92DRAFT_2873359 [Gautieria morchelliformis]